MISLDQVGVQFGGFELFREISILINPRDRIGLVGNNGAGKTTLLRILNGTVSPNQGTVTIPKDLTIGYLPQQMKTVDKTNIYDETLSAFSEIMDLEREIQRINAAISERQDYESKEYIGLIEELSEKNELLRIKGGPTIQENVEKTLPGLGFKRHQFHRPTAELSGGWRMRIELAKILLAKPELILLDEPTNHLDIESIQWIENFLATYPGAIVLVSHDKAFLDSVTNRTIEISRGKIYDYNVPYSKFVILQGERREQQLAVLRNQQKMIEDNERFIERFRYKNTKAIQVQSRIKQLKKLERIEIDEEDTSSIKINFPPAPRSGTIVIECEGVSKNFGPKRVLENVDLIIERGEKVAFVGKNGEGKTTLARILVGDLDYHGKCKLGQQVVIGYFAQNQDELLNDNLTVLQTIDRVAVGDIRTKIRSILGAFLFSGDDIEKKVKVLSGGERSRLSLIKLLLVPHNLLILDEPTNHLDMRSKDILKQALSDFNGTLILVSHDREFLDGITDKVFEFNNRTVKENIGGIYDFLRKKKLKSLRDLEQVPERKGTGVNMNSVQKKRYLKKKESDKSIRRLKSEIRKLEMEIGEIENKLGELDRRMTKPGEEIKSDDGDTIYISYKKLQDELQDSLEMWEKLNLKLESLIGPGDSS
jgi:ATP-binding cassette subfamily F protein 3